MQIKTRNVIIPSTGKSAMKQVPLCITDRQIESFVGKQLFNVNQEFSSVKQILSSFCVRGVGVCR